MALSCNPRVCVPEHSSRPDPRPPTQRYQLQGGHHALDGVQSRRQGPFRTREGPWQATCQGCHWRETGAEQPVTPHAPHSDPAGGPRALPASLTLFPAQATCREGDRAQRQLQPSRATARVLWEGWAHSRSVRTGGKVTMQGHLRALKLSPCRNPDTQGPVVGKGQQGGVFSPRFSPWAPTPAFALSWEGPGPQGCRHHRPRRLNFTDGLSPGSEGWDQARCFLETPNQNAAFTSPAGFGGCEQSPGLRGLLGFQATLCPSSHGPHESNPSLTRTPVKGRGAHPKPRSPHLQILNPDTSAESLSRAGVTAETLGDTGWG